MPEKSLNTIGPLYPSPYRQVFAIVTILIQPGWHPFPEVSLSGAWEQFKAEDVLEMVQACRCTMIHGVPTMFIAELEKMKAQP